MNPRSLTYLCVSRSKLMYIPGNVSTNVPRASTQAGSEHLSLHCRNQDER